MHRDKVREYNKRYRDKFKLKQPIIDVFSDFKWHTIEEIASKLNTNPLFIEDILLQYIDSKVLAMKEPNLFALNRESHLHVIADGFYTRRAKSFIVS
jgi:hypothetical protein